MPGIPGRRRGRLTRDLLIDACLRLSDAEGVSRVTLRRIGAELEVDATAVYRHFRSKRDLLAATADRVLLDALASVRFPGGWREDVRALALTVRAAYLRHPGLATFVAQAQAPLPNEARLCEAGLSILVGAGFPDDEAVLAYEAIEAYTLSVSSLDAATASVAPERWQRAFARLPADQFPTVTRLAPALYADGERRFEFGLDLLLDALEARRRTREIEPRAGSGQ